MNGKLLFHTVLFLAEMFSGEFAIIASMSLFLHCRWSKSKSFFIFIILGIPLMGITALNAPALVRMLGTTAIGFALLLLVTKDKLGKLILIFVLYYIVLVFCEAAVSNVVQWLNPQAIENLSIRIYDYSWKEKLLYYDYFFSFFTHVIAYTSLGVMYLLYRVFGRDLEVLRNSTFRPFLPLVVLQLVFALMTTYFINVFVKSAQMLPVLGTAHAMTSVAFLWILWQLSVAEQRLRIEKKLDLLRSRNEMDEKLYRNIREKLLENGKLRHDIYNKMQIVDLLLSSSETDRLKKAENIIHDMSVFYNK